MTMKASKLMMPSMPKMPKMSKTSTSKKPMLTIPKDKKEAMKKGDMMDMKSKPLMMGNKMMMMKTKKPMR